MWMPITVALASFLEPVLSFEGFVGAIKPPPLSPKHVLGLSLSIGLRLLLFVWMDTFVEEGKWFCLTSRAGVDGNSPFQVNLWNRTNTLASIGEVNPNTAAAGNQTQHLVQHQATTQISVDWNLVCSCRNLGVHTAPGRTPGMVWTHWRPLWAFSWFPIYKPSSNSPLQEA